MSASRVEDRNLPVFLRITLPLAGMNALTQAARTVMSVIGPVLAVQFALSAGELGFLSGTLFVCYCLAQLPVGLALDLYGPRRVQFCLGLVSAIGFALFALADGLAGFAVARAITGIGIAGGLIGMLKANSRWYDRHRVATMTGLGMMVGTLGSLAVTVPAQRALALVGWRGVFWALAGIAAAVALWNLLSVRERIVDPPASPRRLRDEVKVIGSIYSARLFWQLMPGAAVLSILNFSYAGLWAGPWLRDVAGIGDAARADVLLCYTLGLMAGGPLTGFATSWAQARGHHPMIVPWLCGGGLAVVQLGLLVQPASVPVIVGLWVLFAFFAAAGPAAYASVALQFPESQTGRVATAINAVTLAGVFALQIFVGWLLDLWPVTATGGWQPRGYAIASALMLALQLAAGAAAVLLRTRSTNKPADHILPVSSTLPGRSTL
jgi:MFS family permease